MIFEKRNDNFHLKIGARQHDIQPVTAVLDTDAGSNLFHKRILPPAWKSRIRPPPKMGVQSATKKPVKLEGVLTLHMRVGDLGFRV